MNFNWQFKRFLSLTLVLLMVFLVACHSDEGSTKTNKVLKELEGVWGRNNETYTTFEFVSFSSGQMQFATYCGHSGRVGNIEKISQTDTNRYEITVVYPADDDYFGETIGEETEVVEFSLIGKVINFNPNSDNSFAYEYMGADLDEAIYTYDNVWENIPYIPQKSDKIEPTLTQLKRELGYYLNGPQESWKNVAEQVLYLHNLDDVECYFDNQSKCEIYGCKDDEIIFCGAYGLAKYSFRVKEFLDTSALTIEPKTFYIPYTSPYVSFSLYIWKIDNGYLCITALNDTGIPFYDRSVTSVMITKDLKYLAYYQK